MIFQATEAGWAAGGMSGSCPDHAGEGLIHYSASNPIPNLQKMAVYVYGSLL